LSSKDFWSKIQHISGWLALLLLVVSIISGYGWDIRTSDLVSKLTGGLLNRRLASDLHSAVVFLLVVLLLLHAAPSVKKFFKKLS
jgi:hypothetical protein